MFEFKQVRFIKNFDPTCGYWKFSIGKVYMIHFDDDGDPYVIDDFGDDLWISRDGDYVYAPGYESYIFKVVKHD